jgi:hypothetical protein
MRFSILLVPCAWLAGVVLAQDSAGTFLGPEGSAQVSIHGIKIPSLTGKPFSGSDSIDWTRTLEDGSVLALHQDAKLARDGQGRVYREKSTRFPANSDQKSRVLAIFIMDPVAHTRTECVLATRRCEVDDFQGVRPPAPLPEGSFSNGKSNVVRESLGTDSIDGLEVVGTRETVSMNPGVVGNTDPLTTMDEYWYSPDLEVNLSITRKDPREGTLVIHVVDLARSEPDPSLFQVPANFRVEDQRRSAKSGNPTPR